MLSRCLYISICSALYTSTQLCPLAGVGVWRVPLQSNRLPWLFPIPPLWYLGFTRANVTIKSYSDGSGRTWPISGCLKKRKRTANPFSREQNGDLLTTPKVHVPDLKSRRSSVQGLFRVSYGTPTHVRGLLVRSGIHKVEWKGPQLLQYPRSCAFPCASAGRISFSTTAASSGKLLKLKAPEQVKDRIVSPGRTKVSSRKLVQQRRARAWRGSNLRPVFVRLSSRKPIDGKVEKGVTTISGTLETRLSIWTTALARIRNLHCTQKPSFSKETSGLEWPLSEHKLVSIDSANSLESWITSSRRHKLKTWPTKLILALRESPLDALRILSTNLQSSGIFLPRQVVKDCFDHLAWLCLNTRTLPSDEILDLVYRTACNYLEVYGQKFGSTSLSQRTIRLLSRHCDADQLVLFLEKLNTNTAFIHTNTKLHLMAKFVEYGKVGRALSLLKGLPAQDLVLDQVQMFCVMLLRAELEVENLYRLRSNLLAFMLEAGVRPNRFLANIIILNAMEAGDLNTAWRSHGIATENGLAPDAGTYTALLKGIQHGDNRNNVWLIYKEAKLGGWLSKSPRLKFELLYAIYLSENGKYRDKPYSNLFPYYREFFDTRPLQELGIFHSQQGYYIAEGGQHVEPSVHALGLILLAWLTENRDNGPLLAAYERYVYYTKHNHPLIAQLAQTDHTANAFIVAFGQSPQTVHICTQVVQDMLKAQVVKIDASQSFPTDSGVSRSNGDAGDLNEASNSEHVKWRTGAAGAAGTSIRNLKNYEIRHIAPPTVQTWNILLFAFIRNRQSDAAEKVLALMEARGQKPDRVTWTSLLNGYARMQDFPGTIGTLERMNQAGFKEDEWTVKALSRVVDRVALLRAFERSTKEW